MGAWSGELNRNVIRAYRRGGGVRLVAAGAPRRYPSPTADDARLSPTDISKAPIATRTAYPRFVIAIVVGS